MKSLLIVMLILTIWDSSWKYMQYAVESFTIEINFKYKPLTKTDPDPDTKWMAITLCICALERVTSK